METGKIWKERRGNEQNISVDTEFVGKALGYQSRLSYEETKEVRITNNQTFLLFPLQLTLNLLPLSCLKGIFLFFPPFPSMHINTQANT